MVDAGMKELITTGYTSNRVRQNMASVLTKDLKLDWRLGAEWYQLCLEDHCVAANFGNWSYFAGTGGDAKNRHFRTISQCYRYDPNGSYVRKWINIRDNDVEAALRPWAFDKDWLEPIVNPETQLTFHDKDKLEKTGRLSNDYTVLAGMQQPQADAGTSPRHCD
jgi:deoxyribodipyrimidine photo-lyase